MTPLKDPVFRSSGVTVKGRDVILKLEVIDGKPAFTLRLKGHTSGWYADAEEVALFAVNEVTRLSGRHAKMVLATKSMARWKQENKQEKHNV